MTMNEINLISPSKNVYFRVMGDNVSSHNFGVRVDVENKLDITYADIRLEITQDLLSEYSFEDFHFLIKNDSGLFIITKEQEKKQVKSFGLYKNGRSGACNDPYHVHIAPGGSS